MVEIAHGDTVVDDLSAGADNVVRRTGRSRQHRRLVGVGHGHRARSGIAGTVAGVDDAEADRSHRGIRRDRGAGVAHAPQRRLPFGEGGGGAGGGQRKHTAEVVVAGDDVAHRCAVVREGEYVLAALEITGDGDRRRLQRRAVGDHGHCRIDNHRRRRHVVAGHERGRTGIRGDDGRTDVSDDDGSVLPTAVDTGEGIGRAGRGGTSASAAAAAA